MIRVSALEDRLALGILRRLSEFCGKRMGVLLSADALPLADPLRSVRRNHRLGQTNQAQVLKRQNGGPPTLDLT